MLEWIMGGRKPKGKKFRGYVDLVLLNERGEPDYQRIWTSERLFDDPRQATDEVVEMLEYYRRLEPQYMYSGGMSLIDLTA